MHRSIALAATLTAYILLAQGCQSAPSTTTVERIETPDGATRYFPEMEVGLVPGQPDFVLVRDGAAQASIVIAEEAATALRSIDLNQTDPQTTELKVAWAAHELRHYVERMSGVALPVHSDLEPVPSGPLILVGRSKLTAPFDDRIPSGLTPLREEEGCLILRERDRLVLAGNDAPPYHGTEYAVTSFLHRLGVRWYMPGDFGEVIPPRDTIAVGDLDVVERPDFKMRKWWTHWFADDLRATEVRWKIRNGMNEATMHAVPGDSSVRAVLPPASERDNPEYALVFAKDAAGRTYPHMPNLASEASVQYAANVIKKHFRANPDATSWGIGADDGLPRDYSEGVEDFHMNFPSMIGRFNDPAGVSTTEEWMHWLQRVAAEVRKEFPDRFLSTNGYANRDTPPVNIDPDPSIWIMFAAIWCDTYHAFDNPNSWMAQRQYEMLKAWTSMYDNVYHYDYLYYNLVGCGAPPIPLARRHMRNMPLMKELGMVGFWNEGRTVRGEAGVFPTYLLARMMWDAHLDAQELQNEYFNVWYGPAAAPAFDFWDEMERAIESSKFGGTEDHMLSLIYTPELIGKLAGHLRRAEAAANGDAWAEPRVRADRATFEYLLAYKAMERAELDADWEEASRQTDAMVDAIRPAMDITRFYWDISDERKPRVGQAHGFYYWGTKHRQEAYDRLAALTNGQGGRLIAVLPEHAKFSTDTRDEGRFFGWFKPDFDASGWDDFVTTKPYFAQRDDLLDSQGFPYLGAMWYRIEFDAPSISAGQTVRLHALAAESEAWVWLNGDFIGHRPFVEPYIRPNAVDMDVTDSLHAGKRNTLVIRLHTNYMPSSMAAGMASRLFLYSPKAASE